jgi:6-pyruvoyltetrahydropterin/6-carboxytetrahydropterin synthase
VATQTISVKHNMEMAHRLYRTAGKCENIHGHSWWVTLTLCGSVNSNGMLEGLDFGSVKSLFRRHLDTRYDHQLLLNVEDPWAGSLTGEAFAEADLTLPGLQTFPGDPTTENVALAIGMWTFSVPEFQGLGIKVDVWETQVNNATWSGTLDDITRPLLIGVQPF